MYINNLLTPELAKSGNGNLAYRGLSSQIDFDVIPSPEGLFNLEELIGEGTYGEVYAARDVEKNVRVAIKILENIADNIEEIEEEYLILRDLSPHPNIPEFYGLFMSRGSVGHEEDQLWFSMEVSTTKWRRVRVAMHNHNKNHSNQNQEVY